MYKAQGPCSVPPLRALIDTYSSNDRSEVSKSAKDVSKEQKG
jgi:hypothetical protein